MVLFMIHMSAVKIFKSVGYRISYIILRGHWCYIIVLYVHAPREEKNYVKDIFCKELVYSINSLNTVY
jgi:hypothetical protein